MKDRRRTIIPLSLLWSCILAAATILVSSSSCFVGAFGVAPTIGCTNQIMIPIQPSTRIVPKNRRAIGSLHRLDAWKPDGGGAGEEDDDDYDFNAAFSKRKSSIEQDGETASFQQQAVTRSAQRLKDEATEEVARFASETRDELASVSEKKISLSSILFLPLVLAIIASQFSIALDPFFKDRSEETVVVENQQKRSERPKSTAVDLKELLREP
jgi:hypothetical protein